MNVLKSFFVMLFLVSGLTSFMLEKWTLKNYESTFGANKPQYKFDSIPENRKTNPIDLKFIEERHRQKKQQLNQEKERKIYRKYLASRSTISFLKDFHTMRY
jgi:hypothetical protein